MHISEPLWLFFGDFIERRLHGAPPRLAGSNYLSAVKAADAFSNRVSTEIDSAQLTTPGRKTAFIVVSGHCSYPDHSARCKSVRRVLDNLARSTAQRLAAGGEVFRLDDGRYALVRRNPNDPEWLRLAVGEDPHSFLLRVFAPDGEEAGIIGSWPVTWRDDQIMEAQATIGKPALHQRILTQLNTAAAGIVQLNELLSAFSAGDSSLAYVLAQEFVSAHEMECPLAVGYKIRLAIHEEDFTTAIRDSNERKTFEKWDLDAHAAYIMAHLATGAFAAASRELETCTTCRRMVEALATGQRHVDEVFPMLVIAQALTQICRGDGPWHLHERIAAALRKIAPHEVAIAERIRKAVRSIQAAATAGEYEILYAVRNELRDVRLDLARMRQDVVLQKRHWKEREAMRRLAVVLANIALYDIPGKLTSVALVEPARLPAPENSSEQNVTP